MTTEIEPVRSNSPELSAMTLPKLKTVATQLGVDGAAKMKKDDLVEAIADLQAKNREAAKAEREARREARNKSKKESKSSNNSASNEDSDDDGEESSPQSNTERGNRNERFDRNDRHARGRDRNRDRNRDRGPREEREPVIGEDDVLVPVVAYSIFSIAMHLFAQLDTFQDLTMSMFHCSKCAKTDFARAML